MKSTNHREHGNLAVLAFSGYASLRDLPKDSNHTKPNYTLRARPPVVFFWGRGKQAQKLAHCFRLLSLSNSHLLPPSPFPSFPSSPLSFRCLFHPRRSFTLHAPLLYTLLISQPTNNLHFASQQGFPASSSSSSSPSSPSPSRQDHPSSSSRLPVSRGPGCRMALLRINLSL